MSIEKEYRLTADLPHPPELPEAVKRFIQENNGHHPHVLIVHPDRKVPWLYYEISKQPLIPAVQPLGIEEIPSLPRQMIKILIQYDPTVDFNKIICRGIATPE